MSTAFKAAADEMRQLIEGKIEEIKSDPRMAEVLKLHQSLNGLEDILGETKTPLEALFGLSNVASEPNKPRIRHDEFAGYTTLEAAKMYLKRVSDARPFKEIVSAILQGGGKVDSENSLATSLARSTLDIVKINDAYGWIDNYPHIKAQRTGKSKKAPKADSVAAVASESSEENGEDLV